MAEDGYDEVDATGWIGGVSSRPPPVASHPRTKTLKHSYSVDDDGGPLRYKMDHNKRGIALIINNLNFHQLPDREGTVVDAERMGETLLALGFDVDVFTNLTSGNLQESLMAKANLDHTDRDCFLCVILTHGDEDHVIGTDGKPIHLKTLISFFGGQRCPTLKGKPKIFILNACQGTKRDEGHDVADSTMYAAAADDHIEEVSVVPNLPYEMDFLYIHSTMYGYYSYRNKTHGSFFMKTLCDLLTQHGRQMEICQLLTLVHRKTAVEFESKAKAAEIHGKKQCPCYLSLLTKQLYFK